MSTASLRKVISARKPGEVFSLKGMGGSASFRKAVSRLEEAGQIARVKGTQGLYYVPKQGALGTIKPKTGDLINALIGPDLKGYRSGVALYNLWGLTTQVPGEVTIVSERSPRRAVVESLNVQYRKARSPITEANVPILQVLDALKDIKNIPGATPTEVIPKLKRRIEKWSKEDAKLSIRLVRSYPPSVRALLGAILEDLYGPVVAKPIQSMLNPGSLYQIGVDEKRLPTKSLWSIL